MPEIFDMNNDEFTLSFSELPSYLTFDEEAHSFTVDEAQVLEDKTVKISITLSDSQGAVAEYESKIKIAAHKKVPEPPAYVPDFDSL